MDKAGEIKPKGMFVTEDFSEGVRSKMSEYSEELETEIV